MSASIAKQSLAEAEETREIVYSRVFDAPRDLVWRMWSDPDHIVEWWGPNGFRTTMQKMEFREGGEWKFVMHGPDGTNYQNKSIYREIVRPERIRYSHVSGPLFEATITFDQEGLEKTRVTMRMEFESAELRNTVVEKFGAVEGQKQTFARLGEKLAALPNVVVERTFDAPRELVFKAWTDQKQLAQWFGPKHFTNPLCIFEAKRGGKIRIDMRDPEGTIYPAGGRVEEIIEPSLIVMTIGALDTNGEMQIESLNTITFDDLRGKTKITMSARVLKIGKGFEEAAAGMREGWSQSFEKLATLMSS